MRNGFTLIEMAVVIIIIALIAGGIFTARGMVRTAEVQSIITEVDRYNSAMQIFVERYGQMPGDFTEAETHWGTDGEGGCPATTFNTNRKQATCNGDGDGQIGGTVATRGEWFRAWQHLANAGVVEGLYSGTGGYTTINNAAPFIMPKSGFGTGAYMPRYLEMAAASSENFAYTKSRHVFELGTPNANCSGGADLSNCLSNTGFIRGEDAAVIDIKLDDGRPGSGKVMARPLGAVLTPNCTTTTDAATAIYNANSDENACALIIATGY